MVGLVHQPVERRLERLGHLVGIEAQGEARLDDRHDRSDDEAGHRLVAIRQAERLDEAGVEPDLFLRLPQRRLDRPLARVKAATREGHLAGVAAHVVRAPGEQDGGSLRPVDNRNQHRRVDHVDHAFAARAAVPVDARAQR